MNHLSCPDENVRHLIDCSKKSWTYWKNKRFLALSSTPVYLFLTFFSSQVFFCHKHWYMQYHLGIVTTQWRTSYKLSSSLRKPWICRRSSKNRKLRSVTRFLTSTSEQSSTEYAGPKRVLHERRLIQGTKDICHFLIKFWHCKWKFGSLIHHLHIQMTDSVHLLIFYLFNWGDRSLS